MESIHDLLSSNPRNEAGNRGSQSRCTYDVEFMHLLYGRQQESSYVILDQLMAREQVHTGATSSANALPGLCRLAPGEENGCT